MTRMNHPDKPLPLSDDEGYIDYLIRTADWAARNPPEPPEGFDLIECDNEPRHYPLYVPVDDDLYEVHCLFCQLDSVSRQNREKDCHIRHRRWKSWNIWHRISSRLYVLGITSSGGGTSLGRCEFCGIGRQHLAPHWHGRRSYILGVKREVWACLVKRRHRYRLHYPSGLCAICCPCPECGSTDVDHYTCEASA